MVFQGCFKGVLSKHQGYFNETSRVFKGRLKGVSREILVGFKSIWKKLKGNITEFLNEFKGCVFPESF